MSATMTQATITISLTDLENLIRRVVREELSRLPRMAALSILDDWSQEGPDDPKGDKELLTEALTMIEEYEKHPEGWKTLEEFEAELAQAEAARELPS
jgi:hypothetical protein